MAHTLLPSQGNNTVYVHVFDGGYWAISSGITVSRDDSVSAPTGISYTPNPVGSPKQYTVTFNAPDTYSTNTNEMGWELRTASGGGGTLIASGTFTQGNGISTGTVTDTPLQNGPNTRWLRIRDGAWNWAETSFTVTAAFFTPSDLEEWKPVLQKTKRRKDERHWRIVNSAGRELEIIVKHALTEAESPEALGMSPAPSIETQQANTITGEAVNASAHALNPSVTGQHQVTIASGVATADGVSTDYPRIPLAVAYGWRWRRDDGDVDSATWYAAQEVPISESPGVVIRLRFGYGVTADDEIYPGEVQIAQYRLQGDEDWRNVEDP